MTLKIRSFGFLVFFICAWLYLKPIAERNILSESLRSPRASFTAHPYTVLHFGFSNALASLLWVDFLQNYSFKKTERDLAWEYWQLKAITLLRPRFEQAYQLGGALLSVFKRDSQGGAEIIDRWIRYYPHRWYAHYLRGHHHLHEQGDKKRAAQSFARASLLGGPHWLASLGVSTLNDAGHAEASLYLAESLYYQLQDSRAKQRLLERISEIKEQLNGGKAHLS